MKNNNNELIDYEELFREVNEKQNNKEPVNMKAVLALVLYFFIMIGGGLIVLVHFVSQRFIAPYDSKLSSENVMNYVANTNDAMGLVNLDEYNVLITNYIDNELDEQIIIGAGNVLLDNTIYKLVISGNQRHNLIWIAPDELVNMNTLTNIFENTTNTWFASSKDIKFYLYIASPIYEHLEETYNVSNDPTTFRIDKNYQIDYGNVINFITYIIITIPMFFIFKRDVVYDYMLLKEDNEPIASTVLKGFALMLLTSLGLGLITTGLQRISGINGDSVNQATIVRALNSKTSILMIISAVILAPIVEELVFRKAIFAVIKSPVIAIIVSTVSFGLIHVSAEPNILNLLIQIIPYVGMGAFLSWYYYYKTDRNITTLILMHAASNLFSVLPIIFS